jgi:hypothetical protein
MSPNGDVTKRHSEMRCLIISLKVSKANKPIDALRDSKSCCSPSHRPSVGHIPSARHSTAFYKQMKHLSFCCRLVPYREPLLTSTGQFFPFINNEFVNPPSAGKT